MGSAVRMREWEARCGCGNGMRGAGAAQAEDREREPQSQGTASGGCGPDPGAEVPGWSAAGPAHGLPYRRSVVKAWNSLAYCPVWQCRRG
jgi:hypothetical protein